jgi:RHS repeat-associated protein
MRVLTETGNTLYYLHSDHLGSTSLTTDSSVNVTARQNYYPYGSIRSGGGMPTDMGYTGQRLDSTGLMHFQARYYHPYLNRWIQPDTIVPDPANPQDLNRYSYSLSNPLKYTDPSGFFSEDQIKQFFGLEADTPWEEVLKFFQEGGILAGRWGWLETLRQADFGDDIDIDWDASIPLPEGHPSLGEHFAGRFQKGADGQLLIIGRDLPYFFDQIKAGLYGEHYDLTHYLREGLYGAVTCWEGMGCDTSSFSTSAIHTPYLRTKVKWERFVTEPMKTFELIEMGGATAFTGGLTVAQMAAVGAACSNPATCLGGAAIMAPNMALTGAATWGLIHATKEYFMHEFTETTP